MDRKSSTRGFTLAELLVVVAIIAVLVAIAIPVFNSQLEKSREATDLANVRSAYAEVMTAAITEDKTATYNGTAMYDSANGLYTATVSPLAQRQDGWTVDTPITIGGITSGPDGDTNADVTWKNAPAAGGSCTIICGHDGNVIINWGDGSDVPSTPGGGNVSVTDIPTRAEDGKTFDISMGNIYRHAGKYYVATTANSFNQYTDPTPNGSPWAYVEIRKDARIITKPDQGNDVLNLQAGDIYRVGDDYYIMKTRSDWYTVPPEGDNWIKINYSAK